MVENTTLVGAFMTVLVAVIVFSVFSGINTSLTTTTTIANETHEGLGESYLITNIPVDSITSIRNVTNEAQTFSTPDDYNITLATGNVTMIREGNFSNYYEYQPSGYITNTQSRNLFTYIAILLAIVILVFIISMIKDRWYRWVMVDQWQTEK